MQNYMIVIYGLLFAWSVFSLYYIYRVYKKGVESIIPYIYDSIPTVFTTLGILGTFVGIFYGLQGFNVDNITSSIPDLLEGLKTAFTTSIWGIGLSLVFGKISQYVLRKSEQKLPEKPTNELSALLEMNEGIKSLAVILKESKEESRQDLNKLANSLTGENDDSISTQLFKLRNGITEQQKLTEKQTEATRNIEKALGGDSETSLLTQIQKLRAEQTEYAKDSNKNIEHITKVMNSNNKLISEKFDEFAELLAKNNTEALVDVMKQATEEFNSQMSALIEKLVQENFQELNNSVQRMNQWQQENKDMIAKLTEQYAAAVDGFKDSSEAISNITTNTEKLTNKNSHLVKLIEELQKVMIEDTKYQEIVEKLVSTINTLKDNTEAFDETTNKLNNWVRNQMNFNESVAALLTRLEEIDRIKDINEVFWENTKKQLNEGVGIIEKASTKLNGDIENINDEFYSRLNDTFQNLDTLIQRIIQNYN